MKVDTALSGTLTSIDWALCGIAVVAVLVALYTHTDGNRFTAILFAYQDIRRDMAGFPRYQVAWRAVRLAMGWSRSHAARRF